MSKYKTPPKLENFSWWSLLMTIWHARRNNRKSQSDYAFGKISVYTRCDEIYFYEDLMFRIFKEMYRRLFDRPFRVGTEYRRLKTAEDE